MQDNNSLSRIIVVTVFTFIIATYLAVVVPSGTSLCLNGRCGYHFWGAQDHDGLWHTAVAHAGFSSFPPQLPILNGEPLRGYNYLLDFLMSPFVWVGISPLLVYFKLMPILWVILFIPLFSAFARAINRSPTFLVITGITLLLTGPLSQIITFSHDHGLTGSAGVLVSPIIHTMTNLPFAFSLLVLTYVLLYLHRQKSNPSPSPLILSLCVTLAFGFKVYAGLITGLLIGLYLLFSSPNILKTGKMLLIFGMLSLAGISLWYAPQYWGMGTKMFLWSPLSLVHPITEDPSLLFMRDLTNARYFLKNYGLGPRLIWIETVNLVLFFVLHAGLKLLGLFYWLYLLITKQTSKLDLSIGLAAIVALIIPVFFIQRGEWWNSMQFFDYGTFLFAWFAARLLYAIWHRPHYLSKIVIVAVLAFAVLPVYDVIASTLQPSGTYIPAVEIEALKTLEQQPPGAVHIIDTPDLGDNTLPRRLRNARSTAYVTALSGHPSYYADNYQLKVLNLDTTARLALVEQKDCRILAQVRYLYFAGRDTPASVNDFKKCPGYNLESLYLDNNAEVYLVNQGPE